MIDSKKSVLIISDGRIGHIHRSEGLFEAINKFHSTSVHTLKISSNFLIPKALLPRLARILSPALYLWFVHGLRGQAWRGMFDQRVDLIISAGGATLGANRALAVLADIPNIYIGKLRHIQRSDIALSLTPYAIRGTPVLRTLPVQPVKINPDDFPVPQQLGTLNDKSPFSLGVLIGGPTKDVPFNHADWKKLAELIKEIAELGHITLVISTSPRTPDIVYTLLGEGLGSNVSLIDFRTSGPNSAHPVFSCDAILVTADSSSMATEAIAARRPVIVLQSHAPAPTEDLAELERQESENRLAIIPLKSANAATIINAARTLEPLKVNHLDILGATILEDLNWPFGTPDRIKQKTSGTAQSATHKPQIVILAGPSGAGKSTFIEQIKQGNGDPAIDAAITHAIAHWPLIEATNMLRDAITRQEHPDPFGTLFPKENFVLHYDITAIHRAGYSNFEADPVLSLLKSARIMGAINIFPDRNVLLSQYVDRKNRRNRTKNIFRKAWRTLITPRLRKLNAFLFGTRFKPEVELYQSPIWLNSVYAAWCTYLNSTNSSNASFPIFYFEPSKSTSDIIRFDQLDQSRFFTPKSSQT